MKISYFVDMILVILLLVLIYLIYNNYNFANKEIKIIKDTIMIEIEKPPIIIEKAKLKIIKKADTLIKYYPFEAQMDTVIKNDTISFSYHFPENELNFKLSSMKDTIIKKIEIERQEIRKHSILDYLPSFLSGIIIGIVSLLIIK